jgi:hypothetical protein
MGLLTELSEYAVLQNTFDLRMDYRKDNFNFYVNPVFVFNDIRKEVGITLRQSYIDIYFPDFDLRIGKQQIVWGKADGVFITDLISPRDLSEFVLPDFEEIRIGINAMKLNYYIGNSTLETIWIPAFQPTIQPEPSSIWFPNIKDFPANAQVEDPQEVSAKFSNSEFALKFSRMGSLFDLEVMAAYLWDDTPVPHLILQPDNTVLVKPKYHRLPLVGTSVNKTVGGALARAEAAYSFDKRFSSSDLTADGVSKNDYLHYLVGYDSNWFDVDVSLQFIQQHIIDYDDSINQDEFTNTLSFLLNKTFLREKLIFNLFGYYGINDEDGLLRFKLSYDLADGINILAGYNLFFGDEGAFGQFNENDMAYLQVRLDF